MRMENIQIRSYVVRAVASNLIEEVIALINEGANINELDEVRRCYYHMQPLPSSRLTREW